MVETINILDRIKKYKWQISPPLDKKVDTVILGEVQEFLKQKSTKHWNELDLYQCLKSLTRGEKLFCFKKLGESSWECSTCMNISNTHIIVGRAPTKIEAYKITLITILKEFYYFPFDGRMELPTGLVNTISGNLFNKNFTYPVYPNIIFTDIQRFFFREKAYDYFTKYSFHLNNQKCVEGALLKILDAERIETFIKDNEKMIKINQFIWIGSTSSNIPSIALCKLLEIYNLSEGNGEPKSPHEIAQLIYEESLKSQSFEEVEVTLSKLVLPD